MCSSRLSVGLFSVLHLLLACTPTDAFVGPSAAQCSRRHHRDVTTSSDQQQQRSLVVLGPVARNGMAYEDVELGQGRRILPGDTVYCYYQGYFTKKPDNMFGKPTKTVFDEISECLLDVCVREREMKQTLCSFIVVLLAVVSNFFFSPPSLGSFHF